MPELTLTQARDARVFAESIINTVRESLVVLDEDLRVVSANASFYRTFQVAETETTGRRIYQLGNGQWDIPKLRELLETIIPRDTQFRDFEVEHTFSSIGHKVMLLNARRIDLSGGGNQLILLAIEDVTERVQARRETAEAKQAEGSLRRSEQQYRTLFNSIDEGFCVIEVLFDEHGKPVDYRFLEVNAVFEKLTGLHEARGKRIRELAPALEERWFAVYGRIALTGEPARFMSEAKTLQRWYDVYAFRLEGQESKKVAVLFKDISESRKAEQSLRESREDLNRAQAVARVGSWRLHTQRNELMWSDEAYRIFNVPAGTPLTYEVFLSFVHPDDREYVDRKWQAALKGEPYDIEHRIIGGGAATWVREKAQLEFDRHGVMLGGFGTVQDITDRKSAEEALTQAREIAEKRAAEAQEGQRLLEAVMDNVPEVILIVDAPDGIIRKISSYLEQLAGLPKAEAEGRAFAELAARMHTEQETGARTTNPRETPTMRALRHGEVINNEERVIRRADGSLVTILVNSRPRRDTGGRIISAITAWRDISERKKAEDLLRRNEYELRTLVDNSPDLIFRFNTKQHYVYANPAYERVTGITRDQLMGRTNSQLGMPRQLVDFWRSTLEQVIVGGRERAVEFDMTSFFGKRYFSARLIPEFARSGLVDTVLVIARDVTERRKAEEQIRYISFHDEVTGLFNRAFFEEELRRVDTGRALPVSIIMGDVNNLKLSNDVFGHEEGDRLLKTLADIIRKACRQEDIVARWGGDEFAVILPGTDFETADAACGRIKQIARESKGSVIQPSVALGVATKENREQNIYQSVRQAEERMYRNKLDESNVNEQRVYDSLFERARERSRDLGVHLDRSYALADEFGRTLSLSESQMDDLRLLIRLHDIGDAVIPQEILLKPGPLTHQEREIMKKHAEAGFRIVRTFADTARVSDEIFSHGERWDGTGYPRGLKEKEIPYLARVFQIIDAFDVMTHARPYAGAFTREEAVEELRRNAGAQFDPELVDAFIITVLKREKATV